MQMAYRNHPRAKQIGAKDHIYFSIPSFASDYASSAKPQKFLKQSLATKNKYVAVHH
jgi:hypothetical protein